MFEAVKAVQNGGGSTVLWYFGDILLPVELKITQVDGVMKNSENF